MYVCVCACVCAEYNHLLTSQLDSQRAYYEGLLAQQVRICCNHTRT